MYLVQSHLQERNTTYIVLRLDDPTNGSASNSVCHLRTNPAAIPGLVKMGTTPSGETEGTLAPESWQNVLNVLLVMFYDKSFDLWVMLISV